MRKDFISYAVACLMAPVALSGTAAYAADYDLGVLELNKVYDISQIGDYTGTFTAPKTGKLTMVGGINAFFTDQAATELLQGSWLGYVEGLSSYEYDVNQNVTYYFNGFSTGAPATMLLEMDRELKLLDVTPEPGSVFSPVGYSLVDLYFNKNVTLGGASLKYGNATKTVYGRADNSCISFDFGDVVHELMVANAVKEGDLLTLSLTGIKDSDGNLYLGTGEYSVQYICGAMPAHLVKANVPTSLLSYYVPGDPAGIATLEFDADLWAQGGEATLTYGDMEGEAGSFYVENVPYTVNGKVMTLDFAGKQRLASKMVSSGITYPSFNLSINYVMDAAGNLVWSDDQGSQGSFGYVLDYNEVPKANIYAEFTPANGASLEGVEKIEVWINGIDAISFDGFKVAYNGGSVVVPMSAVTITDNTGKEAVFTFAVPAQAKGKKNVYVTLSNLVANDGYDHSEDVKAAYDAFIITFADPKNGSQLENLPVGATLSVRTNMTADYPEMCLVYEIKDLNATSPEDSIVKSMSYMVRQDDGTYTSEVYSNVKFLRNHTYSVIFTAWESEMAKNYNYEPLGSDHILWEGLSAPYRFSDITFQSIEPSTDTYLTADQNQFVITFDGLVLLDAEHCFINAGQGFKVDFESITPTDPTTEGGVTYSYQWALVVPESYMQSLTDELYLSVAAYDQDGLLVEGNTGTEENSYFSFVYKAASAFAELVATPESGSVVESLSQISLTDSRGIAPSYNVADPIGVYNNERALVTTVNDIELIGEDVVTEVILHFEQTITAPGDYTVIIPEGYFVIGSELSTWNSAQTMLKYTIEGDGPAPGDVNVSTTPAQGAVNELSSISIVFLDYDEVGIGSGKPTLSINGGDAIDLPDAELDWDVWNMAIQSLGKTYTDEGTYVISYPAGYFVDQNGDAIPAFALTYTIGQGDALNITVTPDPATAQTALSEFSIVFNDLDEVGIGSGKPTLAIDGGDAIDLPDAELDWDVWNKANQPLGETYTAAGTYVISYPDGYFVDQNGDAVSAFTVEFKIVSSGIVGIDADANGRFVVYSASGVKLLDTLCADDLRALPAGLYIINGVKTLIRK